MYGLTKLNHLKITADETMVPSRVEIFHGTCPGKSFQLRTNLSSADAMKLRQNWEADYLDAIFTRVGSVAFMDPLEQRAGEYSGTGKRSRRQMVCVPFAENTKCQFVRLLLHEPYRSSDITYQLALSKVEFYGNETDSSHNVPSVTIAGMQSEAEATLLGVGISPRLAKSTAADIDSSRGSRWKQVPNAGNAPPPSDPQLTSIMQTVYVLRDTAAAREDYARVEVTRKMLEHLEDESMVLGNIRRQQKEAASREDYDEAKRLAAIVNQRRQIALDGVRQLEMTVNIDPDPANEQPPRSKVFSHAWGGNTGILRRSSSRRKVAPAQASQASPNTSTQGGDSDLLMNSKTFVNSYTRFTGSIVSPGFSDPVLEQMRPNPSPTPVPWALGEFEDITRKWKFSNGPSPPPEPGTSMDECTRSLPNTDQESWLGEGTLPAATWFSLLHRQQFFSLIVQSAASSRLGRDVVRAELRGTGALSILPELLKFLATSGSSGNTADLIDMESDLISSWAQLHTVELALEMSNRMEVLATLVGPTTTSLLLHSNWQVRRKIFDLLADSLSQDPYAIASASDSYGIPPSDLLEALSVICAHGLSDRAAGVVISALRMVHALFVFEDPKTPILKQISVRSVYQSLDLVVPLVLERASCTTAVIENEQLSQRVTRQEVNMRSSKLLCALSASALIGPCLLASTMTACARAGSPESKDAATLTLHTAFIFGLRLLLDCHGLLSESCLDLSDMLQYAMEGLSEAMETVSHPSADETIVPSQAHLVQGTPSSGARVELFSHCIQLLMELHQHDADWLEAMVLANLGPDHALTRLLAKAFSVVDQKGARTAQQRLTPDLSIPLKITETSFLSLRANMGFDFSAFENQDCIPAETEVEAKQTEADEDAEDFPLADLQVVREDTFSAANSPKTSEDVDSIQTASIVSEDTPVIDLNTTGQDLNAREEVSLGEDLKTTDAEAASSERDAKGLEDTSKEKPEHAPMQSSNAESKEESSEPKAIPGSTEDMAKEEATPHTNEAEVEARLAAEDEARAEEEARIKAEEEAKLRAEEEAKLRVEEEAKLKAEQEAQAAKAETAVEAEPQKEASKGNEEKKKGGGGCLIL